MGDTSGGRGRVGWALAFAMVWPTLVAWVYFVALARPAAEGERGANRAAVAAYAAGKVIQFAFPLVWVWGTTGRLPRPGRPTRRGLAAGLAFGLVIAAGTLLFYHFVQRDYFLSRGLADRVRGKMAEFGLDRPAA